MESVFLKIFNMSITACWLVLAVVLLRFLLKKAPKWLTLVLWCFVGLRLICPWSFESVFSLIPSTETIPQNITTTDTPHVNSGISYFNSTVNPVISQTFAPTPEESASPMQIIVFIATVVWLSGVTAMLIYTAISYLRLRRKTHESVNLRDNIMLCDRIDTPFILGLFRPKIYLPSNLYESDSEYVIAHEKAHLKRGDHLIKPISFLLLTVYWFNPVLWVAYVLLCRDIELACDEKVIKQMGSEIKKPYSTALINCSIPRHSIAACPLAFGEVGVKSRIKAVLNYKKPAFWIIIVAVLASIVVAVCFLTNPKTVKLKSIEYLSLDNTLESTVSVYIGRGSEYSKALEIDREQLGEILDLKVSKTPISQDRSETRDASNVIVLQTKKDILLTPSSKIEGTYLCFSSEFSGVWIANDVKPTLTYKVRDPEKAQKLFMDIKTANDEQYNNLKALREKFPEYFGLHTSKGLEVYVWQTAPNNYFCGLMDGTNREKQESEIMSLKPATVDEMRLILSTYDVPRDSVFLLPIQHTLSSYKYEINDEYYKFIQSLFWNDDVATSFVGGADGPQSVVSYFEAVYGYLGSPDPSRPTLKLSADTGEFMFVWSGYSSYAAMGKYSIEDGFLKCTTSDAEYHFTFEVVGDRFRFIAAESSKIPEYRYSTNGQPLSPVPDGAMFEPIISESSASFAVTYATAEFDIDGDGTKESVSVGVGPTSGLYTFRMHASSKYSEYYNVFMPGEVGQPSLVIENGKLYVQMSYYDEVTNYLVSTYDNNIVLTLSGCEKTVPYWGNQIKK